MKTVEQVPIEGGTHALGFARDRLPAEALSAVDAFFGGEDWQSRLAPARQVALPAFAIAKTTPTYADLLGDPSDLPEEVETLEQLCDHVDATLAPRALRLPTEEELEAALAGALFSWGDELPEGSPSRSDFAKRKAPRPTSAAPDLAGAAVDPAEHGLETRLIVERREERAEAEPDDVHQRPVSRALEHRERPLLMAGGGEDLGRDLKDERGEALIRGRSRHRVGRRLGHRGRVLAETHREELGRASAHGHRELGRRSAPARGLRSFAAPEGDSKLQAAERKGRASERLAQHVHVRPVVIPAFAQRLETGEGEAGSVERRVELEGEV